MNINRVLCHNRSFRASWHIRAYKLFIRSSWFYRYQNSEPFWRRERNEKLSIVGSVWSPVFGVSMRPRYSSPDSWAHGLSFLYMTSRRLLSNLCMAIFSSRPSKKPLSILHCPPPLFTKIASRFHANKFMQPPSISRKHLDSYLLGRSCRTITKENVLGVLFAKWPSYIKWQVLCFHYQSNTLNISAEFIDESKKKLC